MFHQNTYCDTRHSFATELSVSTVARSAHRFLALSLHVKICLQTVLLNDECREHGDKTCEVSGQCILRSDRRTTGKVCDLHPREILQSLLARPSLVKLMDISQVRRSRKRQFSVALDVPVRTAEHHGPTHSSVRHRCSQQPTPQRNDCPVDLATELWNIILKLWMLICHESQLRYQCRLKLFSILSCNTYCNVCLLSYVKAFARAQVERSVDVNDQQSRL